jgi:hypothetical protein
VGAALLVRLASGGKHLAVQSVDVGRLPREPRRKAGLSTRFFMLSICRERGNNFVEAWEDEFAVTAKLFRQMQLFLEVLNEVLEFRQIFRRRFDQGLVSFQHRLCPRGAVFFFQRYWKSLPVLSYGAHTNV